MKRALRRHHERAAKARRIRILLSHGAWVAPHAWGPKIWHSTTAAEPHRAMLRICEFNLILSLAVHVNGGAHCAMAAIATSTARECTPN